MRPSNTGNGSSGGTWGLHVFEVGRPRDCDVKVLSPDCPCQVENSTSSLGNEGRVRYQTDVNPVDNWDQVGFSPSIVFLVSTSPIPSSVPSGISSLRGVSHPWCCLDVSRPVENGGWGLHGDGGCDVSGTAWSCDTTTLLRVDRSCNSILWSSRGSFPAVTRRPTVETLLYPKVLGLVHQDRVFTLLTPKKGQPSPFFWFFDSVFSEGQFEKRVYKKNLETTEDDKRTTVSDLLLFTRVLIVLIACL